jgi:hypothetical protein
MVNVFNLIIQPVKQILGFPVTSHKIAHIGGCISPIGRVFRLFLNVKNLKRMLGLLQYDPC